MSIPMDFEISYSDGDGHHFPKLVELQKNSTWIVWWDCFAVPKNQSHAAPRIRIAFREIVENGLSDTMRHFDVNVAELGYFQIGTVWRNGRKIGRRVF